MINSYRKICCLLLLSCYAYGQLLCQNLPPGMLVSQFRLAENNVVLLKNIDGLIPLKRLDTLKVAYMPIGFETLEVNGQPYSEGQELEEGLANYTEISVVDVPHQLGSTETQEWIKTLQTQYNLVILGLKNHTLRMGEPFPWEPYGSLLPEICKGIPTIAVVVGRRQDARWPDLDDAKAILAMSHAGIFQQSVSAQVIFGGLGAQGQLPFSIGDYLQGTGLKTQGGKRFAFTLPEMAGMNSRLLQDSIRAIVEEGIREGAYPGAQVLVAKDGQIVYQQTFGYHTYAEEHPVDKNDLYDYASITKIAGPLPALMRLHSEGKFQLEKRLQDYVKIRKNSNKADLTFRQMLAHNARLRPYIPYWIGTLRSSARYPWKKGWNSEAISNGDFRSRTFKADSTRSYNIKITDNLWLHRKYRKKMFKAIDRSPLNEKPGYVYSGLLFFLLPDMISDLTGMEYEQYLKNELYHPLGAYTLTYNPMRKYPIDRIIPTEKDTFFRHRQVQGIVHDEGAAMMAGVSGNAGLFGTTLDLAKLMQMYLNFGTYGGERFISEATLQEFTRCQFCEEGNRRGLGFDKPPLEGNSYMAPSASPGSFGHTGFTGTYTWADPENDLLVVFNTNRVYPSRDRTNLFRLNIRPRLHEALYESIIKKEVRGER